MSPVVGMVSWFDAVLGKWRSVRVQGRTRFVIIIVKASEVERLHGIFS